ncbi:MAG: ABC transporter ATP-binding protein [Microthrixaceae bacterium]
MVAMLEIDSVHKSYGSHRALRGVSFDVASGEVCGLLGPNGAGKTTLVSIVASLLRADSGTVRVDGVDVEQGGRTTRSKVGLAGQETAVYPTITVWENLVLFADLAGLRGPLRAARIDEVAGSLDLAHLLTRPAHDLSGGERRRVHTAMALMHHPAVVLMDEPTTGVDVTTRNHLLAEVRRLAADRGAAVLYSTHYLHEIEQLDASVVIIDHGEVVTSGHAAELVERYGDSVVEFHLGLDEAQLAANGFEATSLTGSPGTTTTAATVARTDGGCRLTVRGQLPGRAIAEVVTALGPLADRVRDVDVATPNLEQVFTALTGRPYTDEETDADDPGATP